MKFNKEQQLAVSHREGPMLVLAGPGSGKTAVITHRTQQLIADYGIAPSSILVVTFTKAAAGQMRERFLKLTGQSATQVTFGTFHGIFYGILRQAYGITSANIAGEEERLGILRRLIQKTSMDVDDENDLIEAVSREISMVKNGRISLDHYYSQSCPDEEFRRIFQEYERLLHGKRLLDFDDLMVYCWKLFLRHPEILAAWQKKFRYILVDEFQDVNQLQYDIVKLLALPENNLFIVGDDDQSIYRFRGARPEIMLNFPREFPQARQVVLKTNYRCSGEIVEKTQNLIRHNEARYEKDLTAVRSRGTPVEIRGFANESLETSWLLEQIRKDVAEGCPLRQIAVLFRTNVGSRMTVERLMEYNLPFTMRDVLPNLYEHWLTKNMIAYMHLAMGGRRREDFLAVMNRPNRYLSREAFYEKNMPFEILYQFYEGKEWMCDRIEKFEHDVKMMKDMTPYAAINYIRYAVGYDEFLKEYARARKLKEEELFDLLQEIQESARGYRTYQEWFDYMEEYKEKLKEHAEQIRRQTEAVTVSTLHSVKGLEFDRVYIMNVNEGSIPYHKAVLDAEVEEERRMFYVGMTRAREKLELYFIRERFGKEKQPSRFLEELKEGPDEGRN
ncbi:MAG TPA: ATP-dependent helicase [Candidatus Pullilachnospira intestinigallinarum]|nr:ATP-dependent helicase [Candidatus Pullilachnospira intestinigallinarum]